MVLQIFGLCVSALVAIQMFYSFLVEPRTLYERAWDGELSWASAVERGVEEAADTPAHALSDGGMVEREDTESAPANNGGASVPERQDGFFDTPDTGPNIDVVRSEIESVEWSTNRLDGLAIRKCTVVRTLYTARGEEIEAHLTGIDKIER